MSIAKEFQEFYSKNIIYTLTVIEAERRRSAVIYRFILASRISFFLFTSILIILMLFSAIKMFDFFLWSILSTSIMVFLIVRADSFLKSYSNRMKLSALQRIMTFWGDFKITIKKVLPRYIQIIKLMSGAPLNAVDIVFDPRKNIRGKYANHKPEMFLARRKYLSFEGKAEVDNKTSGDDAELKIVKNFKRLKNKIKTDHMLFFAFDNLRQLKGRTLLVPATYKLKNIVEFDKQFVKVATKDALFEQTFHIYSTCPEEAQELLNQVVRNKFYCLKMKTTEKFACFFHNQKTFIALIDDDDVFGLPLLQETDNYGRFYDMAREVELVMEAADMIFKDLHL